MFQDQTNIEIQSTINDHLISLDQQITAESSDIIQPLTISWSNEELKQFLFHSSLKIKHNFSFTEIENICRLNNLDKNDSSEYKLTKYKIDKILDSFAFYTSIHHICHKCNGYLGEHIQPQIPSDDETKMLYCKKCKINVNLETNYKNGNFFLHISVSLQLSMLFSKYGDSILYTKNRTKNNKFAIEDVCDGDKYKMNRLEDQITINFNYDGVPVFKSSTFSVHPILFNINELSPKQRKHQIFVSSIWFGRKKPQVNAYFVPFVKECTQLYHNGFNYTFNGVQYNKKCKVLIGVCDSIARCDVRCITQFNGMYGCGLCKHPGIQVEKGKGTVRVYPVNYENQTFNNDLRNHDETVNFDPQNKLGVKGRSILCDIPEFNIIDNLPPDWMHCVALGVCRQFAKMWFDEYFSSKEIIVDSMLKTYKPISGVRPPRPMSDRKHWKAHEWVAWLVYFSLPILQQIFPAKYVQHWALLVEGVTILLKSSIMKSEVYYAEKQLLKFVNQIPELYDICHVSFNSHLLTHLGNSVRNWGPLWTHSAFIYENYNQDILKFIHSSQHVALQICNNYRLKFVVYYLFKMLRDKCSEKEICFLDDMLYKNKPPESTQIVDQISIYSHPKNGQLTRDQFLAFKRNDINVQDKCCALYYTKILVENEIVQSIAYSKVTKRNNYSVQIMNGQIFEIDTFIVIKIENISHCYAIGRYFSINKSPLFRGMKLDYMINLDHKDENLAVVRAHDIKRKVVILPLENEKYVAYIPLTNDLLI